MAAVLGLSAAIIFLGADRVSADQIDWRDYPLCEQYFPAVRALFGDRSELAMDVMAAESGCRWWIAGRNGVGLFQFTSAGAWWIKDLFMGEYWRDGWKPRYLQQPMRNIFAARLLLDAQGWEGWSSCLNGKVDCGI